MRWVGLGDGTGYTLTGTLHVLAQRSRPGRHCYYRLQRASDPRSTDRNDSGVYDRHYILLDSYADSCGDPPADARELESKLTDYFARK